MLSTIRIVRSRWPLSFWLGLAFLTALVSIFSALPVAWPQRFLAIGYGICAQIPSHSFHFDSTQLPLAARCTGTYGGFLLSMIYMLILGRGRAMALPPLKILIPVVSLIALFGIDGINSFLLDMHVYHPYPPDNRLRLATGLGTGLAMAVILLPVLNSTIWRKANRKPVLANAREVLGILLILLCLYLLVVSGFDFLLYPISLVSTLGVILIVSSLNLIPVIALAGKEERILDGVQLLPYYCLALLFGGLELGAIGLFRWWATSSLGIVFPQ